MINLIRKNSTLLLFLLVFITACFFRFYKLSTIPFGLNNDAAWEGSAAIEILKGNIAPYLPYAAEGWRGEGIIRTFVTFLILIIGNNPLAIPLSSDIFGVGLVISSFLLIKNLFDRKLAILSSFFIAISGWHITMSKSGWRAITVPFFTTLLFYFLFKGLENKKLKYFVATGVSLSIITFYTYDAGRVALFFFLFWLFIETATRKSFLKKYTKPLISLVISFFITSFPMLIYAFNNWQNFTSRSEYLFIGKQIQLAGNLSPLINNYITSALLFNVKANGNDFFIFNPLLDKPVAFLFPVGLFLILILFLVKKEKKYFFMLVFFIAGLIPGILSVPNGNRAIGTIPTVYFFAAVGLLYPLCWIFRILRIKTRLFINLIIVIFCIYSAFVTYHNYLGPSRKELPGFYPETLVVTNYIKTIWNDYDIYVTNNYPQELLTFYLYRETSTDAFSRNYLWVDKDLAFLDVVNQYDELAFGKGPLVLGAESPQVNPTSKGMAFFMFTTEKNQIDTQDELIKIYPSAKKFYLWYDNDNIHRVASLVVLIPKR